MLCDEFAGDMDVQDAVDCVESPRSSYTGLYPHRVKVCTPLYPGGIPGANIKSISRRCYLREEAFEWELTKEIIYLPLGCLQGGLQPAERRRCCATSPQGTWTCNTRSAACPKPETPKPQILSRVPINRFRANLASLGRFDSVFPH